MSREYPCVYYDKEKWKKFSQDRYTSWCVLGPCSHETPSNADRIRAMTDEELAKVINEYPMVDSFRFCRDLPECSADLETDTLIPLERCVECALLWLKQPYEEGT